MKFFENSESPSSEREHITHRFSRRKAMIRSGAEFTIDKNSIQKNFQKFKFRNFTIDPFRDPKKILNTNVPTVNSMNWR